MKIKGQIILALYFFYFYLKYILLYYKPEEVIYMKSKYSPTGNHTMYFNKMGNEVPSATTILKILNKPQLVKWANYLGFQHLHVDAVLNEASTLGTIVHYFINSILSNNYIIYIPDGTVPTDLLYSYINRFKIWFKTHTVEPIFLEKSLLSDKFGGTIDFYGIIDGEYVLLDFKTSKKIRLSMFLQLALYTILLEEYGYHIDKVGILLINPKYKDEKYITRDKLEPYVSFVRKLVDLFHSYFQINNDDNWNDNII